MPQPRDIRTVVAPPGSDLAVAQAFVLADATSPATARSLAELGVDATPALKRLEARGLLFRTAADAWYLDVPRYARRRRRRHVMELSATAAVAVLLVWLLARAL